MTQKLPTNYKDYPGIDDQDIERVKIANFHDSDKQLQKAKANLEVNLAKYESIEQLLQTEEQPILKCIKNTLHLINDEYQPMQELHVEMTNIERKQDELAIEAEKHSIELEDHQSMLASESDRLSEYEKQRAIYDQAQFDLQLEKQSIEFQKEEIERHIKQLQQSFHQLNLDKHAKEVSIEFNGENIEAIKLNLVEIIADIEQNDEQLKILTEKLEQLKDKLVEVERERDKVHAEQDRISDLILCISRQVQIQLDKVKGIEDIKTDLQSQLREARVKQSRIIEDIQLLKEQIGQKKKAIKPWNDELKKIMKNLVKAEKELQKTTEAAELAEQTLTARQKEFDQDKDHEKEIIRDLQIRQDKYEVVQRTLNKINEAVKQLQDEFNTLDKELDQLETALKNSQQDSEDKKRLLQRFRSELKTAEQGERKAMADLRNLEQNIVREEHNLQRCREKEQATSRARQETESEVKMLDMQVLVAENALRMADAALSAAILLAGLSFIGAVLAIAAKQAVVTAAQYALNKLRKQLDEKRNLLTKRVHDYKTAQEKRQTSETTLAASRINLGTQRSGLVERKEELVKAKDQFDQNKTAFEEAVKRTKDLRGQCTSTQQTKTTKTNSIRSKQTEASQLENTMSVVKLHIDQLSKEQNECQESIQRIVVQMKICQTDLEMKLTEQNSKVDQVKSTQEDKARIKANLQRNQQEIDGHEQNLTGKLREEHQVSKNVLNIDAEIKMADKTLFELQTNLREEKNRLSKITKEKDAVDNEYKTIEGKLEATQISFQAEEAVRVTFEANLQSKHGAYIVAQKLHQQSQFELDRTVTKIQWANNKQQQCESTQDILKGSSERNDEKTQILNLELDPVVEIVRERELSKQALEEKVKPIQNSILLVEEHQAELTKDSRQLQIQFDDGSVQQAHNLEQLHADQVLQDNLEVRMIENQNNINLCKMELYRATEERKQKESEMKEYEERQAGYPDAKKNETSVTYNQTRRLDNEQTNYRR